MNMLRVTIVFALFFLSSCEKTPYFPEPFGNVDYEFDEGKSRVVNIKRDFEGDIASFNTLGRSIANTPNPIVDTTTIGKYRANQDYYLAQFASMSDFAYSVDDTVSKPVVLAFSGNSDATIAPCGTHTTRPCIQLGSTDWKEVAMNGANYVDAVCQDYLRQIYRLQKNTDGLKNIWNQFGNATETVIGFTSLGSDAANKAIGILGAAFGLGSNAFDIYRNSVLINIDFQSLHSMVKQYHKALIEEKTNINSRSEAVKFIQNYLFQCSPPAIEAGINSKVGGPLNKETTEAAGIKFNSTSGQR